MQRVQNNGLVDCFACCRACIQITEQSHRPHTDGDDDKYAEHILHQPRKVGIAWVQAGFGASKTDREGRCKLKILYPSHTGGVLRPSCVRRGWPEPLQDKKNARDMPPSWKLRGRKLGRTKGLVRFTLLSGLRREDRSVPNGCMIILYL